MREGSPHATRSTAVPYTSPPTHPPPCERPRGESLSAQCPNELVQDSSLAYRRLYCSRTFPRSGAPAQSAQACHGFAPPQQGPTDSGWELTPNLSLLQPRCGSLGREWWGGRWLRPQLFFVFNCN